MGDVGCIKRRDIRQAVTIDRYDARMQNAGQLAGIALLLAIVITASSSERRRALGLAVIGVILFGSTLVFGVPLGVLFLVLPVLLRPDGHPSPDWGSRVVKLCLLLAGAALVVVIWSPEPSQAIASAAAWAALALAIVVAGGAAVQREELRSMAFAIAAVMVVMAVTVIAFRLSPELEAAYYRSSVSQIFLGTAGSDLFSGDVLTSNNAIEESRAAGFIGLNVNRSSMELGVAAVVLMAVSRSFGSKALRNAALLIGLAIPFTGSKTGLTLLILIVVLTKSARILSAQRDGASKLIVGVATLAGVAYATRAALLASSDFIQDSQETLEPRKYLWEEAIRAIGDSPLFGLGFGGWFQRWEMNNVAVPFSNAVRPAHNWFLQAWLDGGIVYAGLHILLAVAIIVPAVRGFRTASNGDSSMALLLTFAPLWVLIHGLGDNTALYGDWLTIPTLGVAFAFARHVAQTPDDEPSDDGAGGVTPVSTVRPDRLIQRGVKHRPASGRVGRSRSQRRSGFERYERIRRE